MSEERPSLHRQIAAIVYGSGPAPAPVLEEAVRAFQERRVVVAGVIEHNAGPCHMELEILPAGTRVTISQNLGTEAVGCRLDTAALADAASRVRMALGGPPELVVFNKFGAREAAGDGLRSEMAEAAAAGLPILTAVREDLLAQWTEFLGGDSIRLACSAEAVLDWWDQLSMT